MFSSYEYEYEQEHEQEQEHEHEKSADAMMAHMPPGPLPYMGRGPGGEVSAVVGSSSAVSQFLRAPVCSVGA